MNNHTPLEQYENLRKAIESTGKDAFPTAALWDMIGEYEEMYLHSHTAHCNALSAMMA